MIGLRPVLRTPVGRGQPLDALREELRSRRGATRRTWRRTKSAAAAAPAWQWVLGCVIAILAISVAVLAISSSPNNFDSQTYHLPRIEHWVQNATVAVFPTDIHRQVDIGPGSEYLLTHLRLLSGGDGAYNLLQFLAAVGATLAASRIAAQLGGGPVAQLATVFLLATTPEVLLQASSTQVDLVAAAWVACLATIVLDEFTRPGDVRAPVSARPPRAATPSTSDSPSGSSPSPRAPGSSPPRRSCSCGASAGSCATATAAAPACADAAPSGAPAPTPHAPPPPARPRRRLARDPRHRPDPGGALPPPHAPGLRPPPRPRGPARIHRRPDRRPAPAPHQRPAHRPDRPRHAPVLPLRRVRRRDQRPREPHGRRPQRPPDHLRLHRVPRPGLVPGRGPGRVPDHRPRRPRRASPGSRSRARGCAAPTPPP